jgi:hypothetical protein
MDSGVQHEQDSAQHFALVKPPTTWIAVAPFHDRQQRQLQVGDETEYPHPTTSRSPGHQKIWSCVTKVSVYGQVCDDQAEGEGVAVRRCRIRDRSADVAERVSRASHNAIGTRGPSSSAARTSSGS